MSNATGETFPPPPVVADRSTVLDQGFGFNPDHWTRRAPSDFTLPAVLKDAPVQGRWPRIDRKSLLDLGRPETPREAVDLYVAVSAWGTGTKAQRVARCARVLHEDNVGDKLLDALQLLWTEDPGPAYTSLSRGGKNKIKYLGPAFFTKVLYFASQDIDAPGPRPLILDANVVRGLNDLFHLGWYPSAQWPTTKYLQYLMLAEDLRKAWGWEHPEQVEYALFIYGRTVK